MMFQDRSLTWYMKYLSNQIITFAEIKIALIREFKKSKSKS